MVYLSEYNPELWEQIKDYDVLTHNYKEKTFKFKLDFELDGTNNWPTLSLCLYHFIDDKYDYESDWNYDSESEDNNINYKHINDVWLQIKQTDDLILTCYDGYDTGLYGEWCFLNGSQLVKHHVNNE